MGYRLRVVGRFPRAPRTAGRFQSDEAPMSAIPPPGSRGHARRCRYPLPLLLRGAGLLSARLGAHARSPLPPFRKAKWPVCRNASLRGAKSGATEKSHASPLLRADHVSRYGSRVPAVNATRRRPRPDPDATTVARARDPLRHSAPPPSRAQQGLRIRSPWSSTLERLSMPIVTPRV
jgi:hypothetical protein